MESRRHMHRRRAGLIVNDDQNVGRDVVRMAASAERGPQQPPPFLRLSPAADDSGGGGVDWSAGVQHQPMEGLCRLGECGTEAACRNLDDGLQHICVCPHDLSPPTADLKCPNRLTVPLTPRPIHNIIPPSGANLTNVIPPTPASNRTTPLNATISTTYSAGFPTRWQRNGDVTMALVTLFSVAFGVVVLASVLCWLWRRRCSRNEKNRKTANATTPLNLKKGLLVAERYTPNPHYSACASPCVPQLRRDMLRFHQEIGEGCFGKVYKGEFRRENDQVEIVAIKVLKDTVSSEAEESFMREVDVMSAFRHPNILTLVGIVQRESGISPWMVFEYMPHGDLAEVLRSRGSRAQPLWQPRSCADLPHELTRTHLLSVALQIAAGMRYLAGQRFVHRDLACRNCLVGTNLIVKIADFGMSRDVYTCDYYKIGGSRLLPVRWMSPESVMYGRFTLESDVWSYGVVLWEIFSYGKQPYYGHNNEEVLKLILQGIMLIPPDDCPGEICDLMRCCWKTEPRDRIRFSEIHKRLEKMVDCCDDDEKLTSVDCCDDATMTSNISSSAFDDNGGCSTTVVQLPRPPPVAQFNIDLLDPDGYLMPRQLTPCEYIQTLPD